LTLGLSVGFMVAFLGESDSSAEIGQRRSEDESRDCRP
jgi:hypothetical protein